MDLRKSLQLAVESGSLHKNTSLKHYGLIKS